MTEPGGGLRARVRQANKRLPPENSIALRAAVTVAVLAAGTATIRQGVGGVPLAVACIVGIPAANLFSHVTRHREGYLLKAFLALGILIAFGAFLAGLRNIGAGVVSDVQVPLAELFLWTQLLHSLDVPARRDLQFSLVSSLVLIAIAGVLSISMTFALHLLVWAIAALVALVLFHRSELGELPVLRAPRAPSPVSSFRAVPIVLVLVVVLGVGAFLLVPPSTTAKVSFPVRLPYSAHVASPGELSNPSLGGDDPAAQRGEQVKNSGAQRKKFGYFGFAERLDTGQRGRPDQTMVMKVRAPRADFWRGQSFDVWDGRTWTMTKERPAAIRGDAPPIEIPPVPGDDLHGGAELVQTFYLEQAGPNVYFAAPVPDQLYTRDLTIFQMSDGSLRAGVEAQKGLVYTVISRRRPVTAGILRAASGPGVDPASPGSFDSGQRGPDLARYLQLPPMPDRIADLAHQITDAAPTTYDKVKALEDWMAGHVAYSLDIPRLPAGADAVDQFLFVDRKGFCEQIGTSLVVMLRALGVPARLAVGYAAGTRNPFTGLFEVHASDAHSWAEVWFPGVGWQGFDPTAHVPLAGDPGPRSAGAGLFAYLNARVPAVPPWVQTALALLGLVVVAAVALWQGAAWATRRRVEQARSWAAAMVDRVEAEGAARGRPRRPSQTVSAYVGELASSVLPDARLRAVGRVLDVDAYSGTVASPEARAQAEALIAEVAGAWPPLASGRRR